MARVIVSAGHTQNEPGAVVDDLKEVDLTRKIANKITSQLRKKGIITLSVPPELDLLSRIEWINKTGYSEETEDICIEIHINDGGKSGLEGWYKGNEENKSRKLTETVVETACSEANLQNQGVKSEFDHPLQSLAFLNKVSPTSTLIECLYIDNPSDQAFLRDEAKLDQLAGGIVKGILEFFDFDDTQQSQDITSRPASQTPPPSLGTTQNNNAFRPRTPAQGPGTPPPQYTPPSPGGPPGRTQNWGKGKSLNREERKKVIEEKYQQILGRKVSDQDLNYFLNLGLSEDQMTKRLVESQEHADMVKESQEYQKIKPEYDELKISKQKLEAQLSDKDEIIKRQNELIDQKNKSIQNLQGTHLQEASAAATESPPSTPAQGQNPPGQNTTQYIYPESLPKQKQGFFDKILKRLNDIFD